MLLNAPSRSGSQLKEQGGAPVVAYQRCPSKAQVAALSRVEINRFLADRALFPVSQKTALDRADSPCAHLKPAMASNDESRVSPLPNSCFHFSFISFSVVSCQPINLFPCKPRSIRKEDGTLFFSPSLS
jgi:hypothetical protein